jgi:ubiquinone/menaquinone biosynthesis C-methylase UbiE
MRVSPSAKFWDRIAERYSKKPVPDEAVYQKKLGTTRGYLEPHMEVLEFGCGTGSTAIAHAPYVKHILATDISAKMLDIARGKAAAAGIDNVTFQQATLDEVDLPDAAFDVVLGLSILHLLDDKEAAIDRVRRLLKPGGVFVSSTVCAGDTMRWIKPILPVGRRLGLMPYVSVFTSDDLVAGLTEAGFEIDHRWQPGRGKALFLVARKPG